MICTISKAQLLFAEIEKKIDFFYSFVTTVLLPFTKEN